MLNEMNVLWILIFALTPAVSQASPPGSYASVNIGINLATYPQLEPVPGYPLYYAPQLQSNYFFYDGQYWIYQDDNWYSSSWYNGPWSLVTPDYVPYFVLRIPVAYYRQPPTYFAGWQVDASPRWGEHWGNDWAQRRSGWDRWNRHEVPAAAPLPNYQRKYAGARYPQGEQQQTLKQHNYHYQPHDPGIGQQNQRTPAAAPAPAAPQAQPQRNGAPRAPEHPQEHPPEHPQ